MDDGFKSSPLEKWLHKNKMKTKEFADQVGCSRPIIWKVKIGLPIWDKYADRISRLTNGEIVPLGKPYGRPRLT